jgi:zinc finger FYVE domain-containing protein 26
MENAVDQNNDDEATMWQLLGGSDETSSRRDEEVRGSFRFLQAPSTSLCLSILDLHDNAPECGKELLGMCDDLSGFLQNANSQVEDFGLIINMIKNLLHNAKVKLLQNSSTNTISMCDTYLSLIDVLEQLLLANCSIIPSLNELRNTESVRRIRNRLLEEERHDLAMNLSTKCGLDTQTVWASWGLIELRRGNYKEARTKFEKCMRPVTDKQTTITQAQMKILTDIVGFFENAPPLRMIGVRFSFFLVILTTLAEIL